MTQETEKPLFESQGADTRLVLAKDERGYYRLKELTPEGIEVISISTGGEKETARLVRWLEMIRSN